ncbi:transcriptional regulator [Gallibacterium sp. AGMB14963]|uniref:transcriptional regulator n=1 Tax=Gallibacterium faecale TaxID=3019086 RepID=UPI0022F18B64|nr:YdaS family helix-turn-helix protein [Gallibacterium sp. AGMB14963]MDA3979859.1 YdaS family helix-turn-helix protein [Gallibacterium sp. AGMB14963]
MQLKDFLVKTGRGSIAKLSKHINVKSSNISFWANGVRKVPAKYCVEIEKWSCNQVTCEELRPDIDWSYLRK